MRVRHAVLSVHDKTGLVDFGLGLAELGIELLSTGGTRRALVEAGVPVREVSEETGFPEILDGRVKTLHPRVHGGILFRRSLPGHRAAIEQHGLRPIDLVVVSLYPFRETVARGAAPEEVIEEIDVGGPTMIRAAAKNHEDVGVVTSPAQYGPVLDELKRTGGELGAATLRALAAEAFAVTAAYDAAIAAWMDRGERLPRLAPLEGRRALALRYGENPHQTGAFYASDPARLPFRRLAGEELSYNNLLDLGAVTGLLRELEGPAAAIVKHGIPCGAAEREALPEAFDAAWDGDPLSAYGGVVGLSARVDAATARVVREGSRFLEVIAAPAFEPEAVRLLTEGGGAWARLRVVEVPEAALPRYEARSVLGGLLVQEPDSPREEGFQVVTRRAPTAEEERDLRFALRVVKHVRSNAVALARGRTLVGVGSGQTSRVDSSFLAVRKACERARGASLASDAFFPFPDGLVLAAEGGVTAVAQPGGSKKDASVIAAADERGVAMVFTGIRHFRH